MTAQNNLPHELLEKNAEDYLEYSKKIEDGLEWIEKNLDKLSLTKISVATLSKRTGIHRNTLGNPDKRGAYVLPQIKRLKELKKQKAEESKSALLDDNEASKEESKIEELEEKLEKQRQETGRQFLRAENLKEKLKEAESALKKLAEQNLALQKDNDELLKRASTKVTSIASKIKGK